MTDRTQDLMNAAYARYQANPSWSHAQFMDQCSLPEATAVRLGNLNNQVCNGGFSQYWYNSYATAETVAALKTDLRHIRDFALKNDLDRYPAAEQVLMLYRAFEGALNKEYDPNKRPVSSGWGDEDEEPEDASTRIEAANLDNLYYAVNDDFMAVAELWIVATFAA